MSSSPCLAVHAKRRAGDERHVAEHAGVVHKVPCRRVVSRVDDNVMAPHLSHAQRAPSAGVCGGWEGRGGSRRGATRLGAGSRTRSMPLAAENRAFTATTLIVELMASAASTPDGGPAQTAGHPDAALQRGDRAGAGSSNAPLLRADSALGVPARSSVCMTWRWRLLTSTKSSSTTVIRPGRRAECERSVTKSRADRGHGAGMTASPQRR